MSEHNIPVMITITQDTSRDKIVEVIVKALQASAEAVLTDAWMIEAGDQRAAMRMQGQADDAPDYEGLPSGTVVFTCTPNDQVGRANYHIDYKEREELRAAIELRSTHWCGSCGRETADDDDPAAIHNHFHVCESCGRHRFAPFKGD